MGSRYCKEIPEFIYFVKEGDWMVGPFVRPQRGRDCLKFKLVPVVDNEKEKDRIIDRILELKKYISDSPDQDPRDAYEIRAWQEEINELRTELKSL